MAVEQKKYLDLNGLSTLVNHVKQEINKINGDNAAVVSRVDALESDLADHIDLYDALVTNVTTLTGTVTDHTTDIANNANAISALEIKHDNEIAAIDDEITALKSADTTQDGKIEALETAVDALEAKTIKDLTIGGVVYNGESTKTVTFSFTEEEDGNVCLIVGGEKVATLNTSKFTKDAVLKGVTNIEEEGVKYIKFTFNLDGENGGTDDIKVPLSDIFSGKAADVKITTAINNDFVKVAANTSVEDALVAIAAAGNDLKADLVDEQAAQDAKIEANEAAIAANKGAIEAFVPITVAEIQALFADTTPTNPIGSEDQ